MRKLIAQLPLPIKLILIGIIPLIMLIINTFQIYNAKNEKIQMLSGYLERIDESAAISKLVNDLQLERRYSFGFVLKNQWRADMLLMRSHIDTALANLSASRRLRNLESYTLLSDLKKFRDRIDGGTARPDEVLTYYTNAIFRLNTLNTVAAGRVVYFESANADLQGQKLLQEMITYLGIVRSNIYFALATNNPSVANAAALKGILDIYRSYEVEFKMRASPEAVKAYETKAATGSLRTTMAYINALVETNTLLPTYTEEQWWSISVEAVNDLQGMQKSLLASAQQRLQKVYKSDVNERNYTLVAMIVIIGLVLILISVVIAVINNTMKHLQAAAETIAKGATDIKMNVRSRDAIGSLAKSIHRIDQNNRQITKAAEAIGRREFDVPVVPRSDEDLLGIAIVQMKDDLQQFTADNDRKLWLHSGMEKINFAMQGEKTLDQLSSDTLHVITEYVGADLGVMYLADNELLTYAAGYAVPVQTVPKHLKFGETIAGEAAVKKQVMKVDVPKDFLKVSSATGSTMPSQVVVVPLCHNNVVEGVLEVASLNGFNETAIDLLRDLQGTVALILRTAKNRMRMQELLEETQTQAEELQAQHTELENINAELEAQAEKLQVSEEELKVQQEELMQANQELEERTRLLEERNQQIAEQNLEIQKKAEELAISTKYKSEFLANMSHELRTPLNSILLLSRLLSENNDQNLTNDQVEYARVIMTSGNGLLTLIDEILDLSKIEAGKMELEFTHTSIQSMLRDMKAMFDPIANEKNLQLNFDIERGVPSSIETDKVRLEQILKNLLSNALKFTSQGSVSLTVAPLPDQEHFICFSVKDTGIGIPHEKQKLIFEAFQQADGSTRRKFGGTGLGLSISRELVRLLGGEIKVTSEPGSGSEFTIYVPIKKMERREQVMEQPAPPQNRKTEEQPKQMERREKFTVPEIPQSIPDDRNNIQPTEKSILIIEDDVPFAKALLDFTRSKGYKGLVAVRGDEGIELAKHFRPTGILLDLQLPVKDGWEVMDELKENRDTRHIPVHMMSAMQVEKESLYKGAVDFINKPFAFEQMQEIFRKIEKVVSQENKKVLIVEENSKHASALAYFLETFDIRSTISHGAKDGAAALKNEGVNCVIMDMGIPDKQGYEMLETMKKEAGMENLPVIIFTGKSLSKTEESKIRQYADTIVVKTAHSYKRILDEVSLFLHLVEEEREKTNGNGKSRKLGALQEVLAGKKVMVVDDDVRNIFSLTRALERHKITVVSAVDGKEALEVLAKNEDVDAVLMDIMMPEMDGYETMKRIRKQRKYQHLPIIAVTAKAMTGDREKCIQAGASDYISKPVDIDQLMSLLRVWLYDKGF